MTAASADPAASVHVDTGRIWRGGQGQVLLLLRGLGERGERTLLVAPPGSPLADRARSCGVAVETRPLRGEWDLASALSLARLLVESRARVVHAHTAHAVTLAGIAGRIARTPLVVAARRVDFPVSLAGRFKLRALADVVVAVSEGVRQALVASGVDPRCIEVVRSGVELSAGDPCGDRFRERERLRSALGVAGAPLVGAVGALVDHKDHRTLVAAAALVHRHLPDVRFAVAGCGELEGQLRAQIHALGLDGVVHLLGFRDDIPDLLRAFDLFVLPSHHEGLGTSALDAMAAGVPLVAARAGGIPEMVEDGVTGLLVPPRDAGALAAAIERLLADAPLARYLARAARHRLEERFGAARMASETLALYHRHLLQSASHV